MLNGRRLERLRRVRRLTQKQLAARAALSPAQLSRIIKGALVPDPHIVVALANALETPAPRLLGEDPAEIDPRTVAFRSLKSMSARDRDAALALGSCGVALAGFAAREYELLRPDRLSEDHPGR